MLHIVAGWRPLLRTFWDLACQSCKRRTKSYISKGSAYDPMSTIASFASEVQNCSNNVAHMARPSILSNPYCQRKTSKIHRAECRLCDLLCTRPAKALCLCLYNEANILKVLSTRMWCYLKMAFEQTADFLYSCLGGPASS